MITIKFVCGKTESFKKEIISYIPIIGNYPNDDNYYDFSKLNLDFLTYENFIKTICYTKPNISENWINEGTIKMMEYFNIKNTLVNINYIISLQNLNKPMILNLIIKNELTLIKLYFNIYPKEIFNYLDLIICLIHISDIKEMINKNTLIYINFYRDNILMAILEILNNINIQKNLNNLNIILSKLNTNEINKDEILNKIIQLSLWLINDMKIDIHYNNYGINALSIAFKNKIFEVAQLLINKGCDINQKIHNKYDMCIEYIDSIDSDHIEFLIKNGYNINNTLSEETKETRFDLFLNSGTKDEDKIDDIIKTFLKYNAVFNNKRRVNIRYKRYKQIIKTIKK